MLKLLTLIVIAVASVPAVVAAAPDAADKTFHTARVRAADARAATLLAQGLERSQTVRALVTELQRRDVIVYVEMQPSLRGRLAGMLTWVTATARHRYVRISLNPQFATDFAIATLGHELQHALEVANAPEIVCEKSLEKFYTLHGEGSRSQSRGWDTEAARAAGEGVRRELASAAAGRGDRVTVSGVTESIQQFDPDDWLVVYRRARGMLPP